MDYLRVSELEANGTKRQKKGMNVKERNFYLGKKKRKFSYPI